MAPTSWQAHCISLKLRWPKTLCAGKWFAFATREARVSIYGQGILFLLQPKISGAENCSCHSCFQSCDNNSLYSCEQYHRDIFMKSLRKKWPYHHALHTVQSELRVTWSSSWPMVKLTKCSMFSPPGDGSSRLHVCADMLVLCHPHSRTSFAFQQVLLSASASNLRGSCYVGNKLPAIGDFLMCGGGGEEGIGIWVEELKGLMRG